MALEFTIPPHGVSINRPQTGSLATSFPIRVKNTGGSTVTFSPTITGGATGLTLVSDAGIEIAAGAEVFINFTLSALSSLVAGSNPTQFTFTITQGADSVDLNVQVYIYDVNTPDRHQDSPARVALQFAAMQDEAMPAGQHKPGWGIWQYFDEDRYFRTAADPAALAAFALTPFPKNTVHVSPQWINAHPPYHPLYNTIADAFAYIETVDATNAEVWNVIVHTGIYNEDVTVDKNRVLRGQGGVKINNAIVKTGGKLVLDEYSGVKTITLLDYSGLADDYAYVHVGYVYGALTGPVPISIRALDTVVGIVDVHAYVKYGISWEANGTSYAAAKSLVRVRDVQSTGIRVEGVGKVLFEDTNVRSGNVPSVVLGAGNKAAFDRCSFDSTDTFAVTASSGASGVPFRIRSVVSGNKPIDQITGNVIQTAGRYNHIENADNSWI